MRKLFSEYGLIALALVAGCFGLSMFLSVIFNNHNSLSLMLDIWVSHLM